ncbi:ribbon-helix-helix domain-containing protein [Adlercreutzia sp. ZJ473]|uniref:ribbon-helix-helix domain-containing protein n=1 Tax=Adlercreutzia sp. ZJ473 TaxID=2722822 RepID=UPI001C131966|nr:ribbon-helix-helix domain-containing protein [Adlercreutzia sp. ZJ473]
MTKVDPNALKHDLSEQGPKEVSTMTEYGLADGTVLTAADIERECIEYESGTWEGRLERIHVGPVAVADEPLVSITVKFPASMVAAIDGKSGNRSDYIRRAVAATL